MLTKSIATILVVCLVTNVAKAEEDENPLEMFMTESCPDYEAQKGFDLKKVKLRKLVEIINFLLIN